VGQETRTLPGQKEKPAKKKSKERATSDERKSVLDAAMSILEKRRGKKINGKTKVEAGKVKKTASPRRVRKTAAAPTPKTREKKRSVPDLPLPEESARSGLPEPKVETLKGKLVTAHTKKPEPKAATEKKSRNFEAVERAKARRAAAKKKADVAFAKQPTATFPDDVLGDTVQSNLSAVQANMKEDRIKEEYEQKLRAEREARLKAEARSRVEDTARKILKAEREEKKRIREELESKLKLETRAKSTILNELDGLKHEMANLRTGTTARMDAENEIGRLREMLAEKDREIFRYKKQIDERADKKITAIIETIQSRKAPRPASGDTSEPVSEISKTESVYTSLGDLSKDNPIFDGLPTIELEKPQPVEDPLIEEEPQAVGADTSPMNRIAHYLKSSRRKSHRYRQALLVALPVAFLILVVLGARAFFSNAPDAGLAEAPEQKIEEVVSETDGLSDLINQASPVVIDNNPRWNPNETRSNASEGNRAAFGGQPSVFPKREEYVPEPPAPKDKSYKVKPGDSLWVICRKEYGSGIHHEALSKYNNLKKGQILKIGMELKLPAKKVLVPGKKKEAKKASKPKVEPYRNW